MRGDQKSSYHAEHRCRLLRIRACGQGCQIRDWKSVRYRSQLEIRLLSCPVKTNGGQIKTPPRTPGRGLILASPCLDERGANSSTVTAPSCSPLRIRETSCGGPIGMSPKLGFRGHPNCGSPFDPDRRHGLDTAFALAPLSTLPLCSALNIRLRPG